MKTSPLVGHIAGWHIIFLVLFDTFFSWKLVVVFGKAKTVLYFCLKNVKFICINILRFSNTCCNFWREVITFKRVTVCCFEWFCLIFFF